MAPLVAACGGGTPHTATVAPSTQTSAAQTSATAASVPQTASRGVMISVHLPLRNSDQLDALIQSQTDKNSPQYHKFLTPAQFRATYGPRSADLQSAATTLQSLGFTTHVTSQGVLADAPQSTVESAFRVRLQTKTVGGRSVLSTDRAPTLPDALARLNASVAVVGMQKQVLVRRVSNQPFTPTPQNRYAPNGPYWFTDLKQAYGYPSYQAANGAGRTIGIVIPSDVLDSDLARYFGHEALATPLIVRRPVGGGAPFDPNSDASVEASLDVQQSLGSAPGAKLILYNIPDLTDSGIIAGYIAVVEDNLADVVSSSFGGCELGYTAQYNNGIDYTGILRAYHDIFRQGNAQGITFVASSGDFGAYCFNGPGPYLKGVSVPAADPAVTAVGGTNLLTTANGTLESSYVGENAYPDPVDTSLNEVWGSGGGVSVIFPKPFYQNFVPTGANMRTVPDISMHMGGCPVGTDLSVDPCTSSGDRSSVVVAFAGNYYLVVGTSASSPEFAGLLAVTEQNIGTRLGNANAYIYGLAALFGSQVYRHNIPGSNNDFSTHPPYDYVIGVGTPQAAAFALMPNAQLAGNPGTPSNP